MNPGHVDWRTFKFIPLLTLPTQEGLFFSISNQTASVFGPEGEIEVYPINP
jgi:hypothetical protein